MQFLKKKIILVAALGGIVFGLGACAQDTSSNYSWDTNYYGDPTVAMDHSGMRTITSPGMY